MTSVCAVGPQSLLVAKAAQPLTSWAVASMKPTLMVCTLAGTLHAVYACQDTIPKAAVTILCLSLLLHTPTPSTCSRTASP